MKLRRLTHNIKPVVAAFAMLVFLAAVNFGQAKGDAPTFLRIGEKLSYNVAFESFPNVAFFETAVVSRGKFSGRDAVELRGRMKTFDIVSAAFSLIDETRTVYAAPDTGLPLYISRTINSEAIPKETKYNFLTAPTSNFDLLTMVFKVREAGGNGTFSFDEDGESFVATFAGGLAEKVKTDAGEFDTVVSTVQSTYFDVRGIKELQVNLSSDEFRIPVLIRFKTVKGQFVCKLSGLTVEEVRSADPTPTPAGTPVPAATPKPRPTPEPYLDNQPLLRELAFALGETLEYKITSAGQETGKVVLQAKERKLIQNIDTLVLTAKATNISASNKPFVLGDAVTARVNPETLAPFGFEVKFNGQLASFNQTAVFDARTGAITAGAAKADSPVGTHSLLSLVYAMRSFNLKPSKNTTNPVNDTRVAVFWGDKTYIFVLRPNDVETITLNGEKIAAQMIAVKTGNPQLDALSIKVWLSIDDSRVPLRISAGAYQADLISTTNIFQ
ncbi:MAG: DUF3108 domain-containing protein [Pyrinomonadaceae bacterium]|nr:DUF3108 domain-containing protein [Pyrinomonadaceae bacterium]